MKCTTNYLILLVILFLFIIITTTTCTTILPLESTLKASDPNSKWVSPSKTFVFTFITQQKLLNPTSTTTTSSAMVYYAAILYDNSIPIWVAGGYGGAADSSAELQLFFNGNLVLINGTTGSKVWQSDTDNISVSAASFDDSGNFILRNATVSNIWSTFANPTDTIVPTQNFTSNNVLRSGYYSFKMLFNGKLILNWNDTIEYYNSGLINSTANITSPSLSIEPIGIVSLSDPSLSESLTLLFSSDYAEQGDILRFIKLDDDGNLRIYSSAKGSGRKIVSWSAMSNQCEVFGYCGNNGICRTSDTSPVCGCASGNFEFIDPTDGRKGCKRTKEIKDCLGNETILELDHAVFLTYPPENSQQAFSSGISACRGNCLASPACVASTTVTDGTGFCYLKMNEVMSFVSGYQSSEVPSTSFIKVCPPVIGFPPGGVEKKNGRKLKVWVVVVVVLGSD